MLGQVHFFIRLSWVVSLAALPLILFGQESDAVSLSSEEIQNRISTVEQSNSLTDTMKTLIAERYRAALSDIELASGYRVAVQKLQNEQSEAPTQIRRIRAELERRKLSDSSREQDIPSNSSPEELERIYGTVLASRREAEAELERLTKRLEEEYGKPSRAREKIISLRTLIEDLKQEGQELRTDIVDPLSREAFEVATSARVDALEAEIELLDQQLLGNRIQIQLLRAKKENAAYSIREINTRLSSLREILEEARMQIFEKTRLENLEILEQDSVPGVLSLVAKENLEMIGLYQHQLKQYDSIEAQRHRFDPMIESISRVFQNTKLRLELEQTDTPLGQIIREEQEDFPKPSYFASQRREVNEALSRVGLRLINAEAKRNVLLDKEVFLQSQMEELGIDSISEGEKRRFLDLVAQYEGLLDQTITNDIALEKNLHELDDVMRELKEQTEEYDQFLEERLLWIRSSPPIHLADFSKIAGTTKPFFDLANWKKTVDAAWKGVQETPWKTVWFFLVLVLLFSRRWIYQALVAAGKPVGKINKDRFAYTLEGLFFTILLVLPFPLLCRFMSDVLTTGSDGDPFVLGLARAFYRVTSTGFFLLGIQALFMSDGIADKHFQWKKNRRMETSRVLRRFAFTALPLLFLTVFIITSNPARFGGILGLAAFAAYTLSILYLAYSFLHPKRGLMRFFYENRKESFWWRWRWVWFLMGILAPITLVLLAWYGYIHTTADLYFRLESTAWVLAGVWLLSALVRRNMLILRRKLMYEAVKKKQESERKAQQDQRNEEEATIVPIESDTHEIDQVSAMDNDTRQLFNAGMLVLALAGLAWIWEDVFPALKILDSVSIWTQTTLVEGVETIYSVSLADFLRALVLGFLAFILAKNLPSLINILLIRQGDSSSGTRYAISTLLQYAIIAIGTLLVFRNLGVTGEQLGWVAAALGVGIGFGLQEIVANFISGIIVLFEQPVRVGDVVTIGNATGVVSRIHIRATTIRDWENKELLVPNRELITGQVLNWTLSDTITRVEITVGIAYGSDVQEALDILVQTAQENPRILDQPAPFVHFEQFGDNSLNLTLRAFVPVMGDRLASVTEMNKVIDQRFKEAGIEIAFPQMDIHVKGETPEQKVAKAEELQDSQS